MRITYNVKGQNLIQSAFIPTGPGMVYLITGVENLSFGLIGGIITKLFPVKEKVEWPQLQFLMENYMGELTIQEGKLPASAAYVGVNPDHYFFFQKVKEEMMINKINSYNDMANSLSRFGLNASFIERRILGLSGGEKMKVALAIAFSLNHPCYVFHGVIPWLDKNGREKLIEQIRDAKKKNSCVILLEHEVYPLRDVINQIFEFDGMTTKQVGAKIFSSHYSIRDSAQRLLEQINKQKIEPSSILEFKNVKLHDYPSSESVRTIPLLNEVSFRLEKGRIYTLVGENGAGKSTLVRISFRVLKPDSGDVIFCGKSIQDFSREELVNQICYVGQFPEQQITLSTIGEYILKAQRKNSLLSLELIKKWLELPDYSPISLLSPFQMKLLLLASGVTDKTKLIILDEPNWGLDQKEQTIILELLNDISRQLDFTLLIITHNLNFVFALDANILWLNDSQLSFFESVESLVSNETACSRLQIPVGLKKGNTVR
jgi:energy-coupling factor transporter ATP-binding protein EcfA2